MASDGNLTIKSDGSASKGKFKISDPTGEIKRVGIFSDAEIANLNAGAIEAQKITVNGKDLSELINQQAPASTQSAVLNASDSARVSSIEDQLQLQTSNLSSLTTSFQQLTSKVAALESLTNMTASDSALLKNILESPVFTALTASQSAGLQLSLENIEINTATISGDLNVLGRSTFEDLSVTGNINAGLLSINGLDNNGHAAINTSAGALKIQSHGLYGLDILDGKVTIAANGDINTQGQITAKKVNTDKINITADTVSSPSAILSTSAGFVTIPAGDTTIDINTSALTSKSLIFVTPDQPVIVGAKPKDTNTFTIKLEKNQPKDIRINWWVVN
jgi:hypothetical protein